MGSEPWSCFARYHDDLDDVLEKLKRQEFRAGRFRGADETPRTIEDALYLDPFSGTASILDIQGISWEPQLLHVTPLSPEKVRSYFGTDKPTREMVEQSQDYYDDIERGHGICFIVYEEETPAHWFFAGYSLD